MTQPRHTEGATEPTDEQILEIGLRHFRKGHEPTAEKNFVAAVREVLASYAAPQHQSADLQAIRHTLMTGLAHNEAIAALGRIATPPAPNQGAES